MKREVVRMFSIVMALVITTVIGLVITAEIAIDGE